MAADNVGKIVIVGGGIIGCSVAYHLTELGVPCTLVERCSIACAASGKAGGFLARTWCDGNATGPLARASFDLHKKYGAMFDCDYRALDTIEITVKEANTSATNSKNLPEWINSQVVTHSMNIGNTTNTAQVHPQKLSECFIKSAQKKGCHVIIDQVTGVEFSETDNNCVTCVKLSEDRSIPCDILILCMGPWTNTASDWFDHTLPMITPERAHSVILSTKHNIPAQALFVEYTEKSGAYQNPEVYPRPDGTVYICGYNDKEPLPEHADLIAPNEESIQGLQKLSKHISPQLADCSLEKGQACYLPMPPGNSPVIGRLPAYKSVYMAAGHYCWGILNSPATGKGLAELIVNGKSSIDLSAFDPANFI